MHAHSKKLTLGICSRRQLDSQSNFCNNGYFNNSFDPFLWDHFHMQRRETYNMYNRDHLMRPVDVNTPNPMGISDADKGLWSGPSVPIFQYFWSHSCLVCHYCTVIHLILFGSCGTKQVPFRDELKLVQKTIYRKSSTQNGPRSKIVLVALTLRLRCHISTYVVPVLSCRACSHEYACF